MALSVMYTSRLLVKRCQARFHSTMVTLPLSLASTRRCRRAFFSSINWSSDQLIHSAVDSMSFDRPSNSKFAPAPLLAVATPMTEAAVTPEPPPETNHVSSEVKG